MPCHRVCYIYIRSLLISVYILPPDTHSIRRANQLVDDQFTQQPPRARPQQQHQPLDDDADTDKTYKTDAALVAPAAGNATATASGGSHVLLPQVAADARTYQILVRMLVRAKRLGEAFELVKALRKEKGAGAFVCLVGWLLACLLGCSLACLL